jgi:non-homologous end joining protein Ku
VLKLIETKASGKEPELPEPEEREEAPDLAAALEASLAGSADGGRRGSSSKRGSATTRGGSTKRRRSKAKS